MPVRARLVVACAQALLLLGGARILSGSVPLGEPWFQAGALMVLLSTQVGEPYYSKPADVITGAATSLLVVVTAVHDHARTGWNILSFYLIAGLTVGILALVLGASRRSGRGVRAGRIASQLVPLWRGRVVHSLLFLVAVYESKFGDSPGFLKLLALGVLILGISAVRWDRVLLTAKGSDPQGLVVGLLAPARLLISIPVAPLAGQRVLVICGPVEISGYVLARTSRLGDVWCEIETGNPQAAEQLIGKSVELSVTSRATDQILGAVEHGSTDQSLVFETSKPLELGTSVEVNMRTPSPRTVLFQVTGASVVEEQPAEGARHQVVRVTAGQLGYLSESGSLMTHRWSPTPGLLVREVAATPTTVAFPDNWLQLGCLLGTTIPICTDLAALVSGHTAILGMTRMGKTTLAARLACRLAESMPVVILDQTGEYVGNRGMTPFTSDADLHNAGLTVKEVADGTSPPEAALRALTHLQTLGKTEYAAGTNQPRVLILEEAHQFIPEPAMLGFGAPGREESIKLGLLMMQVRKYGISIILVSQRTAVVAKSALSQCENLLAFRSVDQTGLDYLEAVGGPAARSLLPRLRQGEVLAMGAHPNRGCRSWVLKPPVSSRLRAM